MMVLVSYDVNTMDAAGRARLRRMAKECLNYGVRAQRSVFECDVDPAQWAELRHSLLEIVNTSKDSLRFYFLGSSWRKRIEHHGIAEPVDIFFDTLIT